ncbi:MAG: class I SAM-dependent methyltransferase, partial [Candidatus Aegiribacteria sp.]|nr:class I SAM-dependent methyltransferase [Candidatus Aegiribacteria sp.]
SEQHVCPVWVGHLLSSPLRKLFENPFKILSPYIKEGMTVIDVGCAMGFFSLPMALMVGPKGKVICIDMQEKMVSKLYRKAKKKSLNDRIEVRVCKQDSLKTDNLEGVADFVLASAVVHEVPDRSSFFTQLFSTLKEGGELIVIEPSSHVSQKEFSNTVETASNAGFTLVNELKLRKRMAVLLNKPAQPVSH